MFRNGRNNRNVVLGIRGIQEGVETSSPGRDLSSGGEDTADSCDEDAEDEGDCLEEEFELFPVQFGTDVIDECMNLAEAEDTKCLKVVKTEGIINVCLKFSTIYKASYIMHWETVHNGGFYDFSMCKIHPLFEAILLSDVAGNIHTKQ
jgi:hypothetical protein